ncbi:MAG: PKD domain-containing protein [Nanoarchaeota archaeon]
MKPSSILGACILMMLMAGFATAAEEFEVVISLDHSAEAMGGIAITLEGPANGTVIPRGEAVALSFSVAHDSDLINILCNVTVDEDVLFSGLNGTEDMQVIFDHAFSSAVHSWQVTCVDDIGAMTMSPTSMFVIDLDAPLVSMDTGDNHIFDTDTVELNFTPYDELDAMLSCNLTIDNVTAIIGDIPRNVRYSRNASGISKGRHLWNVSCADDGRNRRSSTTQGFYVADHSSAFSIQPNKEVYNRGESGYVLVDAPVQANLTLFILKPDGTSIIRSFPDPAYPLFNIIDYNDLYGGYSIDALFRYGDQIAIRQAAFNVTYPYDNSSNQSGINFSIEPNKNTYALGEGGYLTIDSYIAANLTLFVSSDNGESFFVTWANPAYPFIYTLNFTGRAGAYTLQGIFSKSGEFHTVARGVTVENSIDLNLETNYTLVEVNQNAYFDAEATGGIGALTYEWRFGDGTTATGASTSHAFASRGSYAVTVKVTDSRGNTQSEDVTVEVKEKLSMTVRVMDNASDTRLASCWVKAGSKNQTTNSAGETVFSLYNDYYTVKAGCHNYGEASEFVDLNEGKDVTIRLIRVSGEAPLVQSVEELPADGPEQPALQNPTELDEVITRFQGYKDDLANVVEYLDLLTKLNEANRLLQNANRDMESLSGMKGDRQQMRIDIQDRINQIRKTTPRSLSLVSSNDYVLYPDEKIDDLFDKYVTASKLKLSKRALDAHREAIAPLQKHLSAKVRPLMVQITYLDGSIKTITVVAATLRYEGDEGDLAVIVDIPKTAAESAADVNFLKRPTILDSDPLVQYPLAKDTSFVFTLDKRMALEEFEKMRFLVMLPAEKSRASSATGYAIADIFQGNDSLKLTLEIIGIAILLLVYLTYQFDLLNRLRRIGVFDSLFSASAFGAKRVKEVKVLVSKGHAFVKEGQFDKATELHSEAMKLYNEMPSKEREKVYGPIEGLYNALSLRKLQSLITDANKTLQQDKQAAKALYQDISALYQALPKQMKAGVHNDCAALFRALQA